MTCLTRLIPILCFGLLTSCDDDDPSDTTDDGMCECPTPNAQGVDYDNASSQLGAANVQDAVDELAARPIAEAPIAGRIERRTETLAAPEGDFPSPLLACAGETDVVLGGSCGIARSGSVLVGFSLASGGLQCFYDASNAVDPLPTDTIELTVVCLKTE